MTANPLDTLQVTRLSLVRTRDDQAMLYSRPEFLSNNQTSVARRAGGGLEEEIEGFEDDSIFGVF